MAAAARKATMSAFTTTQLMPSCEAVQTPLVDRHQTGQDGFPSYKGHVHLAWVLPLSRQNLFFEALQWGRMFLAEIDSSLTAVRRQWLLRSGDAP